MSLDLLLFMLLPLLIGSFITPFCISVGETIGLVDYPDHRKHHTHPTIAAGGLSVFITLVVSSVILLPKEQGMLMYFICATILIILGILDDADDVPPSQRLIVQSLVALLMCFQGGISINNLGNLLGLGEMSLGLWGHALTVFAVIGAINAFNMIDGMDGLLGSTALLVFLSLSLLFAIAGDNHNLQFALLIALSIIPYLWANLQLRPVWLKKIFMGDTGSMLIGFSIVWFLILGTQGESPSFSVVTALWVICFPLMDMTRVMLERKLRGASVLEADRRHLHHLLLDNHMKKYWVLLVTAVFSVSGALVGITFEILAMPDYLNFALFILGFGIYLYWVKQIPRLSHADGKVFQLLFSEKN